MTKMALRQKIFCNIG